MRVAENTSHGASVEMCAEVTHRGIERSASFLACKVNNGFAGDQKHLHGVFRHGYVNILMLTALHIVIDCKGLCFLKPLFAQHDRSDEVYNEQRISENNICNFEFGTLCFRGVAGCALRLRGRWGDADRVRRARNLDCAFVQPRARKFC